MDILMTISNVGSTSNENIKCWSVEERTVVVHSCAPNCKEVAALRIMLPIKMAATDRPECPPSAVIRVVQSNPIIQVHLHEQFWKGVWQECLKNMCSNCTCIEDLKKLPDKLIKIQFHDNYLLCDSYEDKDCDFDDIIIVFATHETLKTLLLSTL